MAFHSAAAKAERFFSDMISDSSDRSDSGKQLHQQLPAAEVKDGQYFPKVNNDDRRSTKTDWHEKFKNIRIRRKGQENLKSEAMSVPFYDENAYLLSLKNEAETKSWQLSSIIERLSSIDADTIPSTAVIKQLGVAVTSSKKWDSMKDLIPCSSKSSLSIAAMKSLVLREKEEKLASEVGDEERVSWLITALFNPEHTFLRRNTPTGVDAQAFYREMHSAPPESFLVKVSEVIGSFKTPQKMALFWCRIVAELRRLWTDEVYIPFVPENEHPDLHTCLLFQRFEVINCCLSRKRRRDLASESFENIMRASEGDSNSGDNLLFAKVNSGDMILRLGVDRLVENLKMLDTGEAIYAPITQEGPLLTEDLIRENEEFVLRTKSVGAGCSQLLSDMQAFKAANPGCILEDFVRWHSPHDWSETDNADEQIENVNRKENVDESESANQRGFLSRRMLKEGNLWRELWETSKPVPAIKQAPLYDEDLAVEGILDDLEDIRPASLFQQLYLSLVCLGFVMAEPKLVYDSELSKLFSECKEYVTVACQGSNWIEKVDELSQVYETVETMIINPEEVLKRLSQTEDSATEPKRRFKMFGLNFGRNLKKLTP